MDPKMVGRDYPGQPRSLQAFDLELSRTLETFENTIKTSRSENGRLIKELIADCQTLRDELLKFYRASRSRQKPLMADRVVLMLSEWRRRIRQLEAPSVSVDVRRTLCEMLHVDA